MLKKILAFALIIVAIYWSFSALMPSKISSIDADDNTFSTQRALVHLKEISKKNKLIPADDLSYHYENKSSIPIKPTGLNIQNPERINQNNKLITLFDQALVNDQEIKISKIKNY